MCGICGFITLDGSKVEEVVINRMMTLLSHRGPDDSGVWIRGNVAIGHSRLAIVDQSESGKQPIVSADGRYILTYNGEIYNYEEIRDRLMHIDVGFRGTSDSEVVVNALAVWGPSALEMFNGMFALALWDSRDKRLLLARDRYGIKPLYYSYQNSVFAFASEQKALLSMPGRRRELDVGALYEYLTFQNILTDKTLMEGVRLLEAGHYAVLDERVGSRELERTKYWDFCFTSEGSDTREAEYSEELSRLLDLAVRRQMSGEEEVGYFLSGGIDSATIAKIASRYQERVKTFTVGFDMRSASSNELVFDETVRARDIAAYLGSSHHEKRLYAGDMEGVLDRLVWHLEEPRVGQSYPNYYASLLARRHVRVVMAGTGGDEIFGGYPWRYQDPGTDSTYEGFLVESYGYWQRLLNKVERKELFKPTERLVKDICTQSIFRDVMHGHHNELKTSEDRVNQCLYLEAKTFLHGLLVVEDKLSMAHGLETRLPFLDNDLVDFGMRCPARLKIRDRSETHLHQTRRDGGSGHSRLSQVTSGKHILREAMRGSLPLDVVNGAKQGFSAPDASWFRKESQGFINSRLLNKKALIYNYLDFGCASRLISEHMNGSCNRRLLIWSLLSVESWLKQYLD